MATRLTSGNVQVRQVGNVPMQQVNQQQTNYMFAANAQAQEANTLARILDDMSNSIGKAAAEKRMEEGQQFVAQNPITAEQVQLAKDGVYAGLGGGIGKISGDLPSYFNAAVRKARGIELNTNFMSEYSNIASQVNAQLEDGSMTIEKAQSILNSAQKGLSSALANVDAGASLQFRAQSGMHGNTVLARGYELELKREKQRREIKFNALWEQAKERIEQTYSRGNLVPFDNIGPVITPEIQVEAIEKQITDAALYFVDKPMQDKMLGEFRKAKTEGRINAVTKELLQNDSYMADPLATLDKIKRGEVGKVSGTLQWMIQNDFDSAAKVTANYMAAVTQRETLERQKKADEKAAAVKEFVPLYDQALAAPEGSAQRRKLTDQIAAIAMRNPEAVPLGVLKDLRDPPKGEGNAMVEFNVLQGIYEGRITKPEEIWSMTKHGLSSKQAVSALKLLNREDKQDQNELDRGLSQRAGIPVVAGAVTVIDPKGAEFKRKQELLAQAREIEARYAREGKVPPTPRQILTEIDDSIEKKRSSEEAKSARNQLTTVYEKKPWINGKITRQSIPALEQKAGNDINKQRELTRIKRLLDEAGE
jgi:hypothetical protein